MAPPRKRTRGRGNSSNDDQATPSVLLADFRTAWLVKGDHESVEIRARGETFMVSRAVLSKQSEYFETCLNSQFQEASKGVIQFDDDVDPKYLALYIGLAYSHCTLVPHEPPPSAVYPEASAPKTPLRDYVEVYKLCDRFLSQKMGAFISKCIDTAIGDAHRALFRTFTDAELQRKLMRDFADGFEALDLEQTEQGNMGRRMIYYFCEGVDYGAWIKFHDDVNDRPRFVANVSKGFALKLFELQSARKILKRKELKGP